jgi:hypothetical protein
MNASTKEGLKVQYPNCDLQSASTLDTYLLASSTSFSQYPIEMPPSAHALLSNYLTYASSRMFPVGSSLKTSPLKSPDWFHFAVADPAMFHAMLYAAATYLALLEGKSESKDTIYHQNQTILILQNRLNTSKQEFDDSALGAISCLATGGVYLSSITKLSSLISPGNLRRREYLAPAYERPEANDPHKRQLLLSKPPSPSKASSASTRFLNVFY